MIAQEVGLNVGFFSHTIVDAHIYTASPDSGLAEYDHVPGLREQLTREPRPLPRLVIAKKPVDQLRFEISIARLPSPPQDQIQSGRMKVSDIIHLWAVAAPFRVREYVLATQAKACGYRPC